VLSLEKSAETPDLWSICEKKPDLFIESEMSGLRGEGETVRI